MLKWLLTPDAFPGDWRGYALNQIGHVVLGAALAWALGWPWALGLCLCWEAVHLARGGDLSDGIEDYGFVAAGAVAVATASPDPVLVAVPFLLSGALLRRGA